MIKVIAVSTFFEIEQGGLNDASAFKLLSRIRKMHEKYCGPQWITARRLGRRQKILNPYRKSESLKVEIINY